MILGIDYGRRKIGLSLASTTIAEAYKVIRVGSQKEAIEKIKREVKELGVEKIVVGISEAKMGKETKEFGKKLEGESKVKVVFQDETLTTHEAQELAIRAGIKRKKRKNLEDVYAATLILQNYIDR